MFLVLLLSILISLHFILLGKILFTSLFSYNKKSNKNEISYIDCGLYGIIFVSVIALLINFFFRLSPSINTLVFILSLYSFFKSLSDKSINKILLTSLCSGLIITITLTLDNIYRPDGGMYHLPFVSILNENKILLGISNIHYRFGFISIIQYLSAISNNLIFLENGITLAACSIYSFTLLFFLKEIFKKNENNLVILVSILFLFFILYEFNRFGEHGNDEPAYMFLFISIIFFLKSNIKEKKNIFNLIIFSSFCFLIKPFLIFSFLMPLFYIKFLFKDKKIFLDRKIIFAFFFIFLWIGKNFLTTSCLIYPVSITCTEKVSWSNSKIYNPSYPKKVSIIGEASAKAFMGWSKSSETNSLYRYLDEANWIKVWSIDHFPVVVKSLLAIIILSIIIIFSKINLSVNKKNSEYKKKILYLLLLFFLSSVCWFFKFPIYRYGAGYLVSLIVFLTIFFIIYKKFGFFNLNIQILKYLIILLMVGVSIKNFARIYQKQNIEYNNYPWPPIFSDGKNLKNTNKKIKIDKNNNYFKPYPSSLCYYSSSPCTAGSTKVKYVKNIIGYKAYIIDE